MDLAEMERFKARAIEIVRKSKNPARSLQLMRIKASSFLDSDVSSGRGACSSRDISLPPQGAIATFVPAGARLAAPAAGPPGWCHFDAKAAEVLVDLGPNHGAVRLGSEVQRPVQLCANDGLGIQQFKICKTKQLLWKFAGQFRDMKISHIRFVHGVLVQEEPDPGGFCLFVKLLAEQKEIADHVPNKLALVLNAISLTIRRWLCLLVGAVYWETKNTSKVQFQTFVAGTENDQMNTTWYFYKLSNIANRCLFACCGQKTVNKIVARNIFKVSGKNNATGHKRKQVYHIKVPAWSMRGADRAIEELAVTRRTRPMNLLLSKAQFYMLTWNWTR